MSEFASQLVSQREIWKLRRRVRFVFQDFRLPLGRTAVANVAFVLEVTGNLDKPAFRGVMTTQGSRQSQKHSSRVALLTTLAGLTIGSFGCTRVTLPPTSPEPVPEVGFLEDESQRATGGLLPPEAASLSIGDVGTLEWPVEGTLVYPFGVQQRANGTVLRWNGIGIRAPVGTPVRAVRGGMVALAGLFEGYGPSVIVSHGSGYYTLYLYLEDIGVVQGRTIEVGEVVGTVGGAETPEGPRVEFQMRVPINGGAPQAVDPVRWLRPREVDR